jgi:hypothetical protein
LGLVGRLVAQMTRQCAQLARDEAPIHLIQPFKLLHDPSGQIPRLVGCIL